MPCTSVAFSLITEPLKKGEASMHAVRRSMLASSTIDSNRPTPFPAAVSRHLSLSLHAFVSHSSIPCPEADLQILG